MRAGKQRGVGLIEVLVAVLVFAIGVLGYAGLQLGAIRGTEEAQARAMATGLAQDFMERMLLNPQGSYVDKTLWEDTYPDLDRPEGWKDCMTQTCSVQEMVEWDINSVRWHAVRMLPAGRVAVLPCKKAGSELTCVVITWGEEDGSPEDCLTNDGVKRDLNARCVVLEDARR